MIILRGIESGDIDSLKKIKIGFEFPDLSSYLYACKRVALVDDKIIGAGFIRLTCEGILIIDESFPLVTRVKVIKALIDNVFAEAESIGLSECHVFLSNGKIRNLLSKLGFIDCNHSMVKGFYGQD